MAQLSRTPLRDAFREITQAIQSGEIFKRTKRKPIIDIGYNEFCALYDSGQIKQLSIKYANGVVITKGAYPFKNDDIRITDRDVSNKQQYFYFGTVGEKNPLKRMFSIDVDFLNALPNIDDKNRIYLFMAYDRTGLGDAKKIIIHQDGSLLRARWEPKIFRANVMSAIQASEPQAPAL